MCMNTIFKKIDSICDALPVISCEYRIKEALHCKKNGKQVSSMSCEGDFELSALKIAAVILVASMICGLFSLVSKLVIKLCGLDK